MLLKWGADYPTEVGGRANTLRVTSPQGPNTRGGGGEYAVTPVTFFSSALTGSQKNWWAHSKEASAIVMAIRHWYVYLAVTEFSIKSDHDPLVKLRNMKDPRGKFAR